MDKIKSIQTYLNLCDIRTKALGVNLNHARNKTETLKQQQAQLIGLMKSAAQLDSNHIELLHNKNDYLAQMNILQQSISNQTSEAAAEERKSQFFYLHQKNTTDNIEKYLTQKKNKIKAENERRQEERLSSLLLLSKIKRN